tara:strand:- start:171 stop:959 length:789 start_codon:yes stop_codon:yes gene_type:complete
MSTVSVQGDKKVWGGLSLPFKATYGKVMMWFFLVSDAFTFSTFLIAYGHLRHIHSWWPDPNVVFSSFLGYGGELFNSAAAAEGMDAGYAPLMFVSLMTFILIVSSVTMVLAVYEGHHMNRKSVAWWMFYTILGGSAFLGCQAIEWTHLIHQGMFIDIINAKAFNPFGHAVGSLKTVLVTPEMVAAGTHVAGPVAFAALFFVITGFHGSHVLSGVIINIVILVNVIGGTYEKRGHYEMVEKVGLYWHFVDLVWVFVFLLFYLI